MTVIVEKDEGLLIIKTDLYKISYYYSYEGTSYLHADILNYDIVNDKISDKISLCGIPDSWIKAGNKKNPSIIEYIDLLHIYGYITSKEKEDIIQQMIVISL